MNNAQDELHSELLNGQFFIILLYTKIIICYNLFMKKVLIVIDDIEFKYFELNKLVTNFWLVFEYLRRNDNVFITLKSKLFQVQNVPYGLCYKTFILNDDIKKEDNHSKICLNDFDLIFFRPDPPVDIDYINASYILSYVDSSKTIVMNSPKAIREKNEKLYINEFQGLIPENIVCADEKVIKEFLFENKEIIIKPTNLCFGSGVYYLNDKDKNINTILKTATNNFKTQVMVQKFLPAVEKGDKRLIYVCGKIFDYCVKKVATNNDFKFNEHNSSTIQFAQLNEEERKIETQVKDKFEKDGIYFAGLDVIDGKIIEINITSPCFFIHEINNIFGIKFEQIIVDRIEEYIKSRMDKCLQIC